MEMLVRIGVETLTPSACRYGDVVDAVDRGYFKFLPSSTQTNVYRIKLAINDPQGIKSFDAYFISYSIKNPLLYIYFLYSFRQPAQRKIMLT